MYALHVSSLTKTTTLCSNLSLARASIHFTTQEEINKCRLLFITARINYIIITFKQMKACLYRSVSWEYKCASKLTTATVRIMTFISYVHCACLGNNIHHKQAERCNFVEHIINIEEGETTFLFYLVK